MAFDPTEVWVQPDLTYTLIQQRTCGVQGASVGNYNLAGAGFIVTLYDYISCDGSFTRFYNPWQSGAFNDLTVFQLYFTDPYIFTRWPPYIVKLVYKEVNYGLR